MNLVLETIKQRYSCRDFKSDRIEKEKIEALVNAALQAPSAMNRQPWKVIVIQDKAMIERMDAYGMNVLKNQEDHSAYQRMMSRGGHLFYNAPCMMVIATENGNHLDAGILVENIALAATSLGLGNVICGMARMVINSEDVLPEGYQFSTSILIGYPTNETGTPHVIDPTKVTYIG